MLAYNKYIIFNNRRKNIMQLNNQKLELIKKIVNARLSKAELKEVTAKAEEILNRRNNNKK